MTSRPSVSLDVEILRHIVNATRDAVVFIGPEAEIVHINRAASSMFGTTEEEALGQPVTLLMPESHASKHASYIQRYEEGGEPRAIGQIRRLMARRRTGEYFPIELSVTQIGHERVRYGAIIRDISARARVEQQLEETERLANVGMLASVFAHEVGNPLNNMFVHGQLLQRKVARCGVEEQLGPGLELIMDELRRLNELLYDFRELYQPSGLALAPVSVVAMLKELLHAQLIEESRGRIELREDIEPGLPPVMGNRDKLKQVFINLSKNAIEAMPEGGRLTLRAERRGDAVVVSFADTGSGIPADFNPFEPFHTTKPDGSGLGLSVVRKIVADHGGTIDFESELGRGTRFELSLRAT